MSTMNFDKANECINSMIKLLNDVQNKDMNYYDVLYSYKEVLHVFFWCVIPIKYRADYLNKFNNSEDFLFKTFESNEILKSIRNDVSNGEFDLPFYYQRLITMNLKINDNEIVLIEDKSNRDNYGAYYTPKELSDAIVKRSIVESISIGKVIDFSCGSGIFLKTYAEQYLKVYGNTKENKDHLIKNIYGVDVDLIALLIAGYEISTIIGEPPINLVLGNPLILDSNSNYDKRKELFFQDRIYNTKMGLDVEFFNQNFDVVLGNPPWEKVRFEERKFFAVSAPEIAKHSLKKERMKLIRNLKNENSYLYDYYEKVSTDYADFKKLVKSHPLLNNSLNGELNTYCLIYRTEFKNVVG
jgi:hypothetical protein